MICVTCHNKIVTGTFCLDEYLHASEPSPLINITTQMKTHSSFFLADSKFAMLSAELVRAQ